MKTVQLYNSLEEVQRDLFSDLLSSGKSAAPRGMHTIENVAVSFSIADPRRRCISNAARKWSLPLALGEVCWHLSASSAVNDLEYYAAGWKQFADSDGQIVGSCYGSKIFSDRDKGNLWSGVRNLLQFDPATRRAVLIFADAESHLNQNCIDAACATSLQFLIREEKLDAVVTMRSNDAVWGLPYDVFLFTFLQEMMALELGLELGTYYHFASSFHVYQRHIPLVRRILESPSVAAAFEMPPMAELADLPLFLSLERALRISADAPSTLPMSPYWSDLSKVLLAYHEARRIGWSRAMELPLVSDRYRPVLTPLIDRPSF